MAFLCDGIPLGWRSFPGLRDGGAEGGWLAMIGGAAHRGGLVVTAECLDAP